MTLAPQTNELFVNAITLPRFSAFGKIFERTIMLDGVPFTSNMVKAMVEKVFDYDVMVPMPNLRLLL